MDSSREVRGYLGIRQGSQYQPDKQIPLDKAPGALADVIVMLAQENNKSKEARLHRTIYRFDQMLRRGAMENDGPRGQRHYDENITQALCHLLNNFGALKADAQSKLASMINHYANRLPHNMKIEVGNAAKAALTQSKLGSSNFQVPLKHTAELADRKPISSDHGRSKITSKFKDQLPPPNVGTPVPTVFHGSTGKRMVEDMKESKWTDEQLTYLRNDIHQFAAAVRAPGVDKATADRLAAEFNARLGAAEGQFFLPMSPETLGNYLLLADAINKDLIARPPSMAFQEKSSKEIVGELKDHAWQDIQLAHLRDDIRQFKSDIEAPGATPIDFDRLAARFNERLDAAEDKYFPPMSPANFAHYQQLADALEQDLATRYKF